jgi:hypothetical protein
MNNKDFDYLSSVLKENINAKISDSHWVKARKIIERNNKKFEAEEKALTPSWEDMHRPFDL